MKYLLDVHQLCVEFSGKRVVNNVSLTLEYGQTLGIIGESGSGKSVTAMALTHLLPFNATCTSTRFLFDGSDVNSMTQAAIDKLRGQGWAMIFQDPVGSFNPAKTIEWHLLQVLRLRKGSDHTHKSNMLRLLEEVGIKGGERVLRSYPFQLSGGMLQRVLILIVIALRPKLIIADEPTTNLDKIIEKQILDLIKVIQNQIDASVIMITHDLLVAERMCDYIAVMYKGEIVEQGDVSQIMKNPTHPYTQALLESSLSLARGDSHLKEIPDDLSTRITEFNQSAYGSTSQGKQNG